MAVDRWLPMGYSLPSDVVVKALVDAGAGWQIYEASGKQRVLTALPDMADRWRDLGLLPSSQLYHLSFGSQTYAWLAGGQSNRLERVRTGDSPSNFSDCLSFVAAIAATRAAGWTDDLSSSLFVERMSRLLPTFEPSESADDLTLAGEFVTGGVSTSLASTRRVRALTPWLTASQLQQLESVLHSKVIEGVNDRPDDHTRGAAHAPAATKAPFSLAGRPELEAFFSEHVIDVVENEERYRRLGITFPGAVLLYGPPGCGKTFAVERLIEYLDWPSFSIDASSVGSPYIHETGKKIAQVFEAAAEQSPSIVVIDEMDAFLAARDGGPSGQHRVEEVAEFLKAIPRASEHRVLVVGMTNRLDSLDPAAIRRGRFDHVLEVGMPSKAEVLSLLEARLKGIPFEGELDLSSAADTLAGRPLSDASFVVKEACRIAARAGLSEINQDSLTTAIAAAPVRGAQHAPRKIGFV